VALAVRYFKYKIDEDKIEESYEQVQRTKLKLTQDEYLSVLSYLKEKAPDSNRMYSTILSIYLKYRPVIGEDNEST
jgi:hypothetical protein